MSIDVHAAAHVVAIVLNWNGLDETLACVGSVIGSDWPRVTVVVVDNGSDEDIAPAIRGQFPEAVVVRNESNLGFTGGMNVGMLRALALGAEYVLLLNNDTIVHPTMVSELVRAASGRADAGMVCPLVLYRDRPNVILSAGLRCDLRRGYQGPPIGCGSRDLGQFANVRAVDAPAGAAMLVPAPVIDCVGMLADELFMYGEDVEWARRIQAAGLRVYVAGSARIFHGLSISSGGADSPFSAYYLTRNSLVVCARHTPLRGVRALARGADILLANLYHARRSRHPVLSARAVLAGWWDYVRGRLGPCSSGLHPVDPR